MDGFVVPFMCFVGGTKIEILKTNGTLWGEIDDLQVLLAAWGGRGEDDDRT